jgi:hypothetical protein
VPQSKSKVVSNKSTIKRISTQNKSISSKNVYKQRGPFVNNPSRVPNDKPRLTKNYPPGYRRVKTPPKDPQQKNRARTTPQYGVRSISGQRKNVFPQKGPFVHNPSQKTPRRQPTVSNKQVTKMNIGSSRAVPPGKVKKRRGAISASRPYISRRSINAFAGFWNKKPKGEKAYTRGDLAGKPLRKKNFETKFPVRINPTAHPYKPKVKVGDQPYSGPRKGGYKSATRSGKAWSGDIAGRKIRGRNLSSKKTPTPGVAVFPPKRTKQKIGDTPYRGRIPGGGYKSVTGTFKKSTGRLPGKTPGAVANKIDSYKGNIRGGGRPFSGKGIEYSGNLKSRRPAKGGGSVSGKGWNNDGQSLDGTPPLSRNIKASLFSGHKKTRVAPKGGGSVSGKMWNNKNTPLTGKAPGIGADGVGTFQGNIKATRKTPSKEVGGFAPKKFRDTKPAMRDQGEEYTGHLKARKPGTQPQGQSVMTSFQGKMRASKKEPSKAVGGFAPKKYRDTKPAMHDQGEEFTGHLKLPKYGKKPHGAEGSLKGIVASKSSIKASEYSKVLKLKYDYIHNPSSSKDALKTREPGKAFARESDYQGNIKMKKFDLFGKKGLHPDATFVKTNKNNVDSERSLLTNFKLFWAKMFGKEDVQPDHLKEKSRKPRYNKDEGQIWYNKHNSTPGGSNSLRNSKAEKDQ